MDDYPTLAVNQTYSLTIYHVALLSDLAARTEKNKSELVREAIELLFKSNQQNETPQT